MPVTNMRALVYEMYLLDKTIEKTAKELKMSHANVSRYYVEFRINQTKDEASSNATRISQIKTIEKELFAHLETRVICPLSWERKYLNLMQTYTNYLVK